MMKIGNDKGCFVELWRELELTRQLLKRSHRRFTVRRVLQEWLGEEATDDLIWEVCRLSGLEGLEALPEPGRRPRRHRELLRALVAVRLGTGMRGVDLGALDAAYSEVFPGSTPINVNKKRRPP